MQSITLGYLVRKARKAKKLLQRQVAAECAMTQVRYSSIERGINQPFEQEFAPLARTLDLDEAFLRSLKVAELQPVGKLLDRLCGDRPRFRHPRARESSVRLAALKRENRVEYNSAVPYLQARKDRNHSRRFVLEVVSDSKVEMLVWLRILKAGLRAHRLSPQRVGFRGLPVVHPETREVVGDCVVPALYGEVNGRQVVILPQQSLLTGVGVRRPDCLVGVRTETGLHWLVAEFDGAFKALPEQDIRAQELGMAVLRFNESEILKPDFATRFWQRVFDHIQQSGTPE